MSFAIFDESYYLRSNPDVKAAVDAGTFSSGLQHFEQYGLAEGRVLVSLLYNEAAYLQTNPDVAAAVAAGTFSSGLQHFILYGEAEGRSGFTFDEEFYLQKYPDVAKAIAAGTFSSGLEHYVQFGQAEGRTGDLFFDEKFYLQQYPEIQEEIASGDFSSGLQHYIQVGRAEGRSATPFNEEVYLELYPDVAAAVETGTFSSGLQHYDQYGQTEGRFALFSGTSGNDNITSFGKSSTITGVDISLVDPGTVESENAGAGEVDILTGGSGSDLFLLGITSSFPGIPQVFYDDEGSDDYAVIQNFQPGSDVIQLAGYQAFFYNLQEVDGNLNISNATNGDLIAIVEGVTSLSPLADESSAGRFQLG